MFAGFEPVLLDTEVDVLRVVTLLLVAEEPAVALCTLPVVALPVVAVLRVALDEAVELLLAVASVVLPVVPELVAAVLVVLPVFAVPEAAVPLFCTGCAVVLLSRLPVAVLICLLVPLVEFTLT